MTGTEYLHATVTADFVHWGVVGVIALVGWLITRWLQRRAQVRAVTSALPAVDRCVCAMCGNPHPRMMSREQMRAFIDDANTTLGAPTLNEISLETLLKKERTP